MSAADTGVRKLVELGAEGRGILKIGKKLGVGTRVVQRVFQTRAVADLTEPIHRTEIPA